MVRKLFLPLTQDANRKPTADAIRKRLGGRASTDPGAGEIVTLKIDGSVERAGVVLFTHGDEIDVWLESGVVRRSHRASAEPARGAVSKDLTDLASDARIFGELSEGQRVRYLHDARLDEGTLVEKCRFGALVLRDDGAIVGVGFRRVWPLIQQQSDLQKN